MSFRQGLFEGRVSKVGKSEEKIGEKSGFGCCLSREMGEREAQGGAEDACLQPHWT